MDNAASQTELINSLKKYCNQLLQQNHLIKEQNEELKAQKEEVKAQNEEMKAHYEEVNTQNEELKAQCEEVKAQMKQNTASIAELVQKFNQREGAKSRDNEETTSRVLLKETGGNPRTKFFFACTLYSHSPQR